MRLPKTYEAKNYESDIYKKWEDVGIFRANPDSQKPHFSISMPPPNETGKLHVGHALGITLQDIMARHARQQGKDVLLLPGTDHAALPVNAIMEKQLAEQGTTKHQIGRDDFLRRTKEFVGNSRNTINSQVQAMGASCDWSRARYTLDDALNRCVNEVFARMYHDGLIYRGHRIVNWDPKLETTISDDEVIYKEEKAPFYTLQYGPFQIGTARPETKFGDKYVVMHPDDKRYQQYQTGDTFEAEWINGKVTATIIKDEAVDPKFGTGVMTITPWHDHTDFDIAERRGLDKEQIIGFDGRLLKVADEFEGMKIDEGRPKIVKKLQEKGLVVKIDENYTHNIALNDRGKGVIEPQIMLQWFVDVNRPAVDWKGQKRSLKEVMRLVIEDGDIKIIPKRFEKVYFHWIDNLRDWCVSRQIWWGHRIPVWYKGPEEYVGVRAPEDHGWHQDPDTLDTWFSSALWTWSTLIDPKLAVDYSLSLDELLEKSKDFKTYHPTSVMETAWDILFFWVARMILATTYATGEIPFKTVYLHGLVRTEHGKKMSKSDPDTIIDPLEVIPKYGTDALRLALISGVGNGNEQRLGISKIEANRNFCNKLWNIARFIEDKVGDLKQLPQPEPKTPADHWILNKLSISASAIESDLKKYKFTSAYEVLYHFVWDDFADWYIEAGKTEPNIGVLANVLASTLKITHPFAPFVTEAIWQSLDWQKTMLATELWPQPVECNAAEAKLFEALIEIVSEIRHITSVLEVKKPKFTYKNVPALDGQTELIKQLGGLGEVSSGKNSGGLKLTNTPYDCWLDIDRSVAHAYLNKLKVHQNERDNAIKRLESRIGNKNYVTKAPESVVAQTRQQLAEEKDLLKAVRAEIDAFEKSVLS
jgi:valyl-tRNA synthetase